LPPKAHASLSAAVAGIGPDTTGIQVDSTKFADLDRLYEQVKDAAGRIDVLFANAGGGSLLPLGAITEEQYEDTFDCNVKGVLFTVQKVLPLLGRGASVILTGSTAAVGGTPGFSAYAASKAAVRSFARNWSLDLKERGIRVNVLSPGPTRTRGLVGLTGPDIARQQMWLDQLAAAVPLGRVGDPDEVASAAVFLASDEASFITGTELFVDGGKVQV
jgi:NAD(P)-dependent dehydrogenase (short-subunit alcohol dehydrogenase family)